MNPRPNAYERYLADHLADPEFRAAFEHERREIQAIDRIANALGIRDSAQTQEAHQPERRPAV